MWLLTLRLRDGKLLRKSGPKSHVEDCLDLCLDEPGITFVELVQVDASLCDMWETS